MGNCCSHADRSGSTTPAAGVVTAPSTASAPSPPRPVIPGPVRNLKITLDPNTPSVTLQWSPPANVSTTQDLTTYDVRFKPSDRHHYDLCNLGGHLTSVTLTMDQGLVPLVVCEFEVRARNFEHVGQFLPIRTYVEWQCKHPTCANSRRSVNEGFSIRTVIYDFCSRECAVIFGETYCLYPGCCLEKHSVTGAAAAQTDFCSDDHLQKATEEGLATVVDVHEDSKKFKDLCKKFRRDWKKAKGKCPEIKCILRIVNPAVSKRFTTYVGELTTRRSGKPNVEQHYHGTSLSCGIQEYLQLCTYTTCGVCGISRTGFNDSKIDTCAWQRFGNGFYFAPESSKSNDYTHPSVDCYRGMFLCEVALGKAKELRTNTPDITGQTSDFDSVRGKTKVKIFGIKIVGGDLNYPEVVVYIQDAVQPMYLLLYQ